MTQTKKRTSRGNVKLACPVCEGQVSQRFSPFCSKRCKDVDLNRWLSGGYALPAEGQPNLSEEDEAEFAKRLH